MNVDALKDIIKNNPEIIEELARNNSANPSTVKGIAQFFIDKSYNNLSDKQKYHFDKSIRPLIEDVKCEGYTHELEDVPAYCAAKIKDEDLIDCYQYQEFYCDSCKEQSEYDACRKERIFRD
jgi:hypothetical protein